MRRIALAIALAISLLTAVPSGGAHAAHPAVAGAATVMVVIYGGAYLGGMGLALLKKALNLQQPPDPFEAHAIFSGIELRV